MAVGYTMEELREIYERNRYKRDVWDKMHQFAPGFTQENLEEIAGETKKEQYEGRKKKACMMKMNGAKPEAIAEVIGMSVNTVKNLTPRWMKEFGFDSSEREPKVPTPFPSEMAQNKEREPKVPTPFPSEMAQDETAQDETAQDKERPAASRKTRRKNIQGIPEEKTDMEAEERHAPETAETDAKAVQNIESLRRKIEELERRNESLKGAVTAAEARYNAAAQGQMAALEEVKKLTARLRETEQNLSGMAQKEAPTVRGLIQEAMELISTGAIEDGERVSIERSKLGTTLFVEIGE